jgi:hypothetical protein
MADEPTPTPQADAPAQPAPGPAPEPAQPTELDKALNIPATEPAQTPTIDPNQTYTYTDASGNRVAATLSEMVAAHQNKAATAEMPEEAQMKLDALDRAMKGDSAATADLLKAYGIEVPAVSGDGTTPADQPAAQPAPDPRVDELTKKTQLLEAQIAQQQQLHTQIGRMQTQKAVGTVLGRCKKELPYTFKHPEGARMVSDILENYKATCKASGIDLDNHPRKNDVLKHAFSSVEHTLKQTAEAFGAPPVKIEDTPQAPGAVTVDDQAANSPPPGSNIGVNAQNQLVDQTGRPIQQMPDGSFQAIPANPPVGGVPTGAAVGAGTPAQPSGPLTPDQMRANMAARLRQLEGQQ